MRLLIISDVHGNLTALNRVLDSSEGYDLVICAGDIVGYGPNPEECVDAIRGLHAACVAGNHDAEVAGGESFGANPAASQAIRIHRRLLSAEQTAWLRGLPRGLELDLAGIKVAVFHGSPVQPLREYVFPLDARIQADQFLELTGTDVIILGHTHVPFELRTQAGFIINPGSVGQPRDGDPRASYAVMEISGDDVEVNFGRVEYDIDLVASRIRERGLPDVLASRLYHGR